MRVSTGDGFDWGQGKFSPTPGKFPQRPGRDGPKTTEAPNSDSRTSNLQACLARLAGATSRFLDSPRLRSYIPAGLKGIHSGVIGPLRVRVAFGRTEQISDRETEQEEFFDG